MAVSGKNKLYKTRFVKTFILLAVIILIISGLQRYFLCGNNQNGIRLRAFYKEDPNSLDMVLLGASEVYSGFSSGEFYRETGVTSYPYAFEGNPVTLWTYELEEILSSQTPKILIVELNGVVYDDDMLYKESSVRYMADNMRSLSAKWDMVKNYGSEDPLSYFFPFIKYHSQWDKKETRPRASVLLGLDLRGYSYMKGLFTHTVCKKLPEELTNYDPDATKVLNVHAEASLNEFLDKCDASGIEHVLFVRFPHLMTNKTAVDALMRFNRAAEIVTKRGYEYVDLDEIADECNIQKKTDYYDRDHLILSGQKKLTSFLAGYLQDKYGLEPTVLSARQQKEWEQCVRKTEACFAYYDDYMKNPTEDETYEICERKDILEKLEEYG